MRRIGIALGAGLWFLFVFWVTYRLTFPSQVVADRLAWEVQERSSYALAIDGAHPWWVGLGGSEVTLSSVDRAGVATELLAADQVRARVSPFGLLTGALRVTGDVTLGDGGIDFYADTRQGERGAELVALELAADGFPLSAIPPIQGFTLIGRGTMDLSAELDAPDGMNKADGHLRFTGEELILESIPEADAMLQAMNVEVLPLVVEELDLDVQFVSGKGRVESGRIATSAGSVDISGQIILMKRVERSKCDLDFEIRPGPDLPQQVLSLMSAAKDGEVYKYKMSGVCARASFRPAGSRSPAARRPAARPRRPAARPRAVPQPDAASPDIGRGRPVPPTVNLGGPPDRRVVPTRDVIPGDDPVEELDPLDEGELLPGEEGLEDEADLELLEGDEEIVPDEY